MGAIGDPLLHRVRGFVVSMSMDENTFLDAIIADPDDDAPRLIFADWLEETGDSDRAELIRIQCALARLEENDERRPGLREREGILMRERYDVWCQDRPSGWWNGRFRRGFLAEVDVNAESFLKCAGPLLRQMPVPYIRFFEARNFLAALAASPHLARLHGLCFPHSALSADDLEALVASPFLTNLQHLCLDGNPLGPSGARRLAASARLPRLIYLGLQGTHLGATGVEASGCLPEPDRSGDPDAHWQRHRRCRRRGSGPCGFSSSEDLVPGDQSPHAHRAARAGPHAPTAPTGGNPTGQQRAGNGWTGGSGSLALAGPAGTVEFAPRPGHCHGAAPWNRPIFR